MVSRMHQELSRAGRVLALAVAQAIAAVADACRSAMAIGTDTIRKRTICAVPVQNGERNTLKPPQAASLGSFHE